MRCKLGRFLWGEDLRFVVTRQRANSSDPRLSSNPSIAHVVFVCDSYHAMVSDRPYRAAIGWAAAIEELTANAGTQFCSNAVDALITIQEAS